MKVQTVFDFVTPYRIRPECCFTTYHNEAFTFLKLGRNSTLTTAFDDDDIIDTCKLYTNMLHCIALKYRHHVLCLILGVVLNFVKDSVIICHVCSGFKLKFFVQNIKQLADRDANGDSLTTLKIVKFDKDLENRKHFCVVFKMSCHRT